MGGKSVIASAAYMLAHGHACVCVCMRASMRGRFEILGIVCLEQIVFPFPGTHDLYIVGRPMSSTVRFTQ